MPNDGLKCPQHEALRGSEDSVGRYGMVGMDKDADTGSE